jgi:hypothetical protein
VRIDEETELSFEEGFYKEDAFNPVQVLIIS